MTILIAAYVRAVRKHPELNRFVVGKRLYAHKDISISYMVLRETSDGRLDEAAIKLHLQPTDTIFDVGAQTERADPHRPQAAEQERHGGLRAPFFEDPGHPLAAGEPHQAHGPLRPHAGKIIEVSPFHCSLFVTNMMSINLPSIYHHLYNFAPAPCSSPSPPGAAGDRQQGGQAVRQLMVPVGAVTDERVCGGASYAVAMRTLLKYMLNPAPGDAGRRTARA